MFIMIRRAAVSGLLFYCHSGPNDIWFIQYHYQHYVIIVSRAFFLATSICSSIIFSPSHSLPNSAMTVADLFNNISASLWRLFYFIYLIIMP